MLRHHRILRNALTQQESGTRSSTSLSSVKPTTTLGETQTPDGSRFLLLEHDGNFYFKFNGTQLMSSDWTESELLLADEACRFRKKKAAPRVLVGGLGLGFSLKRVLELVDAQAEVGLIEENFEETKGAVVAMLLKKVMQVDLLVPDVVVANFDKLALTS